MGVAPPQRSPRRSPEVTLKAYAGYARSDGETWLCVDRYIAWKLCEAVEISGCDSGTEKHVTRGVLTFSHDARSRAD